VSEAAATMNRHTFPRDRLPVLLLENVHPRAAERFREEGYPVEILPGALDEASLAARLAAGVAVLGVRSKTPVSARALAAGPRLLAVAAFCIGTDRIDGQAAALGGRPVFNAPYSNTRSVVELAISEIIALNRRLFDRSRDLHGGIWTKSAEGAAEVRGKKLGIIGYGAIGSQLSVLAEALGMEVHYFDAVEKLSLGNARKRRSLHELLGAVDVVSLHVDGRAENRNLSGPAEFAAMKPGALLLNLSRGHVVDHGALADAIRSGRLAGAAVDVFPEEPDSNGEPFDSVLRGLPNVILTPHIGGSTAEAQEAIAEFAADRLLGFLHRGDTGFAVNMPNVELPEVRGAHRLLHVHENRPGLLAAVNGVLADHGANILAQYLRTDERVGYVVTDVDRDHAPELLTALRTVPGTLRFRSVY
jgi:D-3-phosphoglycerate dehydrogenase